MPAYEHPDGVLATSPEEVQELTTEGYDKCRNQNCTFMVAPQTIDELAQQYGDNSIPYQCPHCGLRYDLAKIPGRPGGTTRAGININEQAQIGEDLVQSLGGIPGYGKFLWFHQGGSSMPSAFDAAVPGWGVEIKTVNWGNQPKARRGIIDPRERQIKLKAVQDPALWAKEMQDPKLDEALHAIGHVQGLLGVLVLLDFDTNLADIFIRPMPHDPEHKSGGIIHFGLFGAVPIAEKIPFKSSLPDPRVEGWQPFHERGQVEEEHPFAAKTALDYAGDALPAQEPQAAQDIADQYPPEDSKLPGEREYKFFYGNGQLHVSPAHDHNELAGHAGIAGDHTGPVAVGYVTVLDDTANWEVQTNVAVHAFSRILKDYTEQVGWKWGGLTDLEGEPVGTGSEYAPKKSMWYVYNDDEAHLYMGGDLHKLIDKGDHVGRINVIGKTAKLARQSQWAPEYVKEALAEWAEDFGYRFADYPGGSNMNDLIKNQQDIGGEDLELYNIYTPNPKPHSIDNDREPSGHFKCPNCGQLFSGWRVYLEHRRREEPRGDEAADGKFPETDMEALPQGHFHEREPQVDPISTPNIAAFKEPKDLVQSPVPFIYDINEDAIYVGEPGQKHSDIHGTFTPGGIVEGTYEPGGKVVFRSMTSTPYSTYHVLDLWHYQHPEFEVTGLILQDAAGNETKLASIDVGSYLRTLALADPAVYGAYQALKEAGGRVYVVGGAVRDALLQKEPKDIDLMVQGVPVDAVRMALSHLPGRVDLTGKDFGVFRYKDKGHEVEIALPRRERSTGEGHQDFDVQTDHTMPVTEDLLRRDFTANAMAVDLDTGQLIDPFGGAQDIEQGILKTVSPKSFEEDPLRTVRALVASSKHGLKASPETRAQMVANADGLLHLPPERIQQELDKLFGSKDPVGAIRLAHETGVLKYILPEVDEVWNFDQKNPHHKLPLGEHLLHVLGNTAKHTDDPDLRLAALLHDIGKPASAWENPQTGSYQYYHNRELGLGADHELVGADMAAKRMNELRYPKDRTQRVHALITHHMYPDFGSVKGARRFLNRVGDHANDLFILRHADRYGKGTDSYQDQKTPIPKQRELVQKVLDAGQATSQADLAVNGNDLIKAGLKPGPQFGAILAELTNEVVEDPTKNTPQYLLNRALELA